MLFPSKSHLLVLDEEGERHYLAEYAAAVERLE